ncbi:MAG: DEAD/DEAH box helicase, partial [Gammaproteobacteria bacterium]|nr:DEAD/DEAH box helicase [Gammaproteobacteria bacterium]
MKLPLNLPPPPKPGQRSPLPPQAGSADALTIAQLAGGKSLRAVVAASPLEAQRLAEEIGWFAPELRVHLLPDWETLPWDHFSPHQDLISERLATLFAVTQGQCDVLIVAAPTAATRLAPPAFLAAHTFFMKKGDPLDIERFRARMTLAGYQHVTQVVAPGEYSVRGGLVNLFPMGTQLPFRIELFDDEIETLRSFDADSQRTLYPVPEIRLLPAREMPAGEAGRTKFRQRFRETFEGDASRIALYKDVSNGILPAGIEYYLPLFFEQTATLFDYLPQNATLCLHHDVDAAIQQFAQDAASRYNLLRGDPQHPLLETKELFLDGEQFFIRAKEFARLDIQPSPPAPLPLAGEGSLNPSPASGRGWSEAEGEGRGIPKTLIPCPTAALPPIAVDRRAEVPTQKFADFIQRHNGRVLLLADSLGRREIMSGYLKEYGLEPTLCEDYASFLAAKDKFMLGIATVGNGFLLTDDNIAIVTESELYATPSRARISRSAKKSNVEGMLRDLSELKPGDPVVHEQHGIARYHGLVNLDMGDGENEFLLLEYADEAKLYVPVSQLHVISRYSGGAPEAAPLHKLGSGAWDKAKQRAMKQVRDAAAELLNIYAQRALRKGHAFKLNYHDYESFAAGFGFEETADQAAAIEAVILDLQSGKPMDRLICGDVGFGKTEVALRAAFIAAMEGKQVAVLAPTTLLVEQHFQSFSNRFADFPVKLAELSRFRSTKESTQAMKDMAEGNIDIIIGTHKLIQKDVKFKNLGLVIIDEEHRFGVQQKERLKALRAEVDVLTLTATPIPRTLAMSLEGLRDFSVIATAPQRRLSIKTFVSNFSQGVIREAVLRELKRGGQVYFLHNEVDTMPNMLEKLETLLP